MVVQRLSHRQMNILYLMLLSMSLVYGQYNLHVRVSFKTDKTSTAIQLYNGAVCVLKRHELNNFTNNKKRKSTTDPNMVYIIASVSDF